ncbi:MAG: DNA replication and repair protein RecF [Chloroflexi bacterium]|nr:DNA replication and repair protein RecF [Chloroflexota bacterium]MYE41945.1 DNA replication and repair protein RecF [Chloroflexota bacterium]
MRLSRLRLSNFRNLAEVELEVPPGVSVYFGQNAQGKTALVEAVYLLAIARSFRAENERELVNFDAAREGGQTLVDGVVEYDDPEGRPHPNPLPLGEGTVARHRVIVGYRASPSTAASGPGYRVHKEIRVDRMRRTATSLVGLVHAVLFSVQDIGLVQGPPSARRRFLDILISQADPLYLQGLQRYQRVLQQRNRLLRMRREGRARPDEMEFWDDELVREGAWLTWRRHEVMDILTPACVRHHRDLGGGETLVLRYRPSVPLSAGADGMTGSYREALQAVAGRERATAATAAGPHRDDFDIIVNGVDMGAFASRGQARTLALALRLAEAETLSAVRGTRPLLLLDDALSEMDADRRRRVLEKTADYPQVMITTTDVEQVSDYFGASAAYFRVDEGRIMPCDLLEMGEK